MSKKSVAERKKEREQSKQRTQVQYGIIAFVVIAAIAAVVYFAATSVPSDAAIPPYVDRTDIFLSDTTAEGYPRLGNPNAPVELREYASFACAGCLSFHEDVFPQLLPLIEGGQMSFVFVPLTTGSVPNPDGANRTAICAGAQGKFWQMHDVLFSWHSLYGNGAFQDGRLRAAVGALSLDSTTFNNCINSDSTNAVLNAALAEGVSSTPSVTVNGTAVEASYEAIVAAVSGLVTGAPVESGLKPSSSAESTSEAVAPTTEAVEEATEETAPQAEATAEATAE